MGGGTGTSRQRSQDFLQGVTHIKNRKLSGFGPLFSWKWGIIPRTLKNGGTRPPVPPCGGAPACVRPCQSEWCIVNTSSKKALRIQGIGRDRGQNLFTSRSRLNQWFPNFFGAFPHFVDLKPSFSSPALNNSTLLTRALMGSGELRVLMGGGGGPKGPPPYLQK